MTTYVTFCDVTEDRLAVIADNCTSQQITESASSQQSSACPSNARYASIWATVAIVVNTGTNPTVATGTGLYIPANTPVRLRVKSGYKIAIKTP